MRKKICLAIKNKQKLKIKYRGTERIIEPHAFGLDKRGEKLRAFQVSGFSESGNSSGWKLFKCEDINSMVELSDSFKVRPGYNHNGDRQIPKIICMI